MAQAIDTIRAVAKMEAREKKQHGKIINDKTIIISFAWRDEYLGKRTWEGSGINSLSIKR